MYLFDRFKEFETHLLWKYMKHMQELLWRKETMKNLISARHSSRCCILR